VPATTATKEPEMATKFTGMNVPTKPIEYVGPFAHVAGIPCPDPYEDEAPAKCPDCGNENLTYDAADPSVGIFGDVVYCEDCWGTTYQ